MTDELGTRMTYTSPVAGDEPLAVRARIWDAATGETVGFTVADPIGQQHVLLTAAGVAMLIADTLAQQGET